MTNQDLDCVELYPKIFVYKNLFKDISKTLSLLKKEDEESLFSPWTPWSEFGEYLSPLLKQNMETRNIEKNLITNSIKQEEQKLAILEMIENFNLATKDYMKKNNVEFNDTEIIKDSDGINHRLWELSGPSIARYKTDMNTTLAMTYHSDYVRKPIRNPGHEFAITALTYFNDDYDGGEIDFLVDGEAFMYKPEAGDLLVFPSGHPDVLTKKGQVYLHGVMPATREKKYINRMYWMKYCLGDQEWFEKEKEFGKDVWKEMQKGLIEEFESGLANKTDIGNARRIR
jgi:hypothetical protein